MTGAAAVHQFVATYEPGAVGAHVAALQAALRAAGHDSEVFAEHVAPVWAERGFSLAAYGGHVLARADDVVVYHLAIGSTVADFIATLPTPLVVVYHNLTPSPWFESWERGSAAGVVWGRHQLHDLAPRAALGIAPSRFSEAEMAAAGFRRTEVVPVLVDLDGLGHVDDARRAQLDELKAEGGADWLFVGRLAPNKAQHDVVKAFAAFRRVYDERARLHLVGGAESERYRDSVAAFASGLGLDGAVHMPGAVGPDELGAYYATADVFVCLSHHEGFGATLVEAMHAGVPVVAAAEAAVPEVVAGGGVLLDARDPFTVAAAVGVLMRDPERRAALVDAGRRAAARFAPGPAAQRFVELVEQVGADAARALSR